MQGSPSARRGKLASIITWWKSIMNEKQIRQIAWFRTSLTLFATLLAYQLGGYATHFSWTDRGWIGTVGMGAALVGLLAILIRNLWRPGAGLRL